MKEASKGLSRRAFVQAGAAASALTAASYRRVAGDERVRVGFIGFGLIGKRHVLDFQAEPDASLVGIAEVHQGRREEALALMGSGARGHADFRTLLDRKDVDAVVVSTPDHWHALMTLMACAAGKDVYVEKPLTLFVAEGRWMVEAARKHGRVVQVGTQQRAGPHYQRARGLIKAGHIGTVTSVRMTAYRNVMPGFGAPADTAPPSGFDWNLWLGPAPARPYNPNRGLYHFRWFWDTSGGQMTNLGQHSLDLVHWFLGVEAPVAVTSAGGRFSLRDNGETPDTQDALIEYPACTAVWSHREAAKGLGSSWPVEFLGTKGSLAISRSGFVVTPDRRVDPDSVVPRFAGAHPVGGPKRAEKAAEPAFWTEPLEDRTGVDLDQFRRHVRDFLDCVKSRSQPLADLESGHRVVTACHLANLSLRLGRKLQWDAARETVIDDPEAVRGLIRPYRAPWDAVLKALRAT